MFMSDVLSDVIVNGIYYLMLDLLSDKTSVSMPDVMMDIMLGDINSAFLLKTSTCRGCVKK